MHIPSVETSQLELVTFSEALASANTPNDTYDIRKWLYAPNFYSEYRYILGTRGSKPLICIGINPSTAQPDALDNTLKSVERIALGNGFDSFIMFNVYAQRATKPDMMEKECNPKLHQENMAAFRYILSMSSAPAICLCQFRIPRVIRFNSGKAGGNGAQPHARGDGKPQKERHNEEGTRFYEGTAQG